MAENASTGPTDPLCCERCRSTTDVQQVTYAKDGRYLSGWWCADCKAARLVRRRETDRRRKLPLPFTKRR